MAETVVIKVNPKRQRGPNLGKIVRGKNCRTCGTDGWYRTRYNHHRPNPEGTLGWRCGACCTRYKRDWKAKNRDKYRDISWRYRGIDMSVDEYNLRSYAQDGRCAICTKRPKRLYADHSHRTGKTRDLLCGRCNWLAQDSALVGRVLAYMERHDG